MPEGSPSRERSPRVAIQANSFPGPHPQYVLGFVSAMLGAPRERLVSTPVTATPVRANQTPVKAVGQDGGRALNTGVKWRDAAELGLEGWPSGSLGKEPRRKPGGGSFPAARAVWAQVWCRAASCRSPSAGAPGAWGSVPAHATS